MREYFTLHRSVFPSYLTIESGRIVHPYTIWKKCVFNLEINISTVLAIRMSSGKSFHVLTVAVPNAQSPYVMSFVLDSSLSEEDRQTIGDPRNILWLVVASP